MMKEENTLPEISTLFGSQSGGTNHVLYEEALRNILKSILPKDLFSGLKDDEEGMQKKKERLETVIPLFSSTPVLENCSTLSFFVLAEYRPNAFKFFFEMISSWLFPGKRLNVLLIYALDFRFHQLSSTVYTMCEVMIQIQSPEELAQIREHLSIIESEVLLGMESSYYARRILEVKGLSLDEKTALIQEHIASLVKRLPHEFDQEVFKEMQQILVMCRDDFKAARSFTHLSRIISVQYLFRKSLREAVKNTPQRRHLSLKLLKGLINTPNGSKRVLGVMVGINFLKEREIFELQHLLNAIRNQIPQARAIEHSFFANRRGQESICTFYVEIEKDDGKDFTGEEVGRLRQELPRELKESIQHVMSPVFMPRNEEEIMRNILSLSNQIKFLNDKPQVFITFDEQTHANLFFTIIWVRTLKPGLSPLQDVFKEQNSFLTYIPERTKNVGFLRKKYPKEATVFRVKLSKEPFLRKDLSINLYEARQAVVLELGRVLGEFRDYNGGMISKQNELLSIVKNILGKEVKPDDLALENFFYSLSPIMMRTLLQPEAFASLYRMLLEVMNKRFEEGEDSHLSMKSERLFDYVLLKTTKRSLKDELQKELGRKQLHSSELANAYMQIYDIHYIGYIFISDEEGKKQAFKQLVQAVVQKNQLKTI